MKGANNMNNDLNNEKKLYKKSCNNINPTESCLLSLPPKQFALLSAILGSLLIDDLNIDQQNALGNFIVGIGQTILISAAQEQSLKNNNSQNDQVLDDIADLKNQITLLNKKFSNQI